MRNRGLVPSLDKGTMRGDTACHVRRCQGEREYHAQYRSTETPGWDFVVLQVWLRILQYSNGKNGKDCGQHLCFPVSRPASKRGTKMAAAPFRSLHRPRRGLSNLPDKLQSELNLPRSCRRPVELMRSIGVFLNREKSKLTNPGPTKVFRPPLPSRFAQ